MFFLKWALSNQINIQNHTLNRQKLETVRSEITQNLKQESQSFEICLEKCSECFLPCKLRRNHIKPEQLQKLNYLQSALSQLQSHIQAEENKIKSTLDIEKCQDQLQNYNQLYEKVQRKQIYLSQKTQLEIEIGIENFESEDSNTYIWQYFIGDNNDLNDNSLESINQKLAQNLDSAKQKYNESFRDYKKIVRIINLCNRRISMN